MGMVNMPEFRANSLTTGIPEYDAFMNGTVFETLERKATALLHSETFKYATESKKYDLVSGIITQSRDEILDALDQGYVGTPNDVLVNERRKLLVYDQSLRADAKKALSILTEDRKLTLFQIELMRDWMEIEKKSRESAVKHF
jgi:hypothetical protein